jgi:hypothetical protein
MIKTGTRGQTPRPIRDTLDDHMCGGVFGLAELTGL